MSSTQHARTPMDGARAELALAISTRFHHAHAWLACSGCESWMYLQLGE